MLFHPSLALLHNACPPSATTTPTRRPAPPPHARPHHKPWRPRATTSLYVYGIERPPCMCVALPPWCCLHHGGVGMGSGSVGLRGRVTMGQLSSGLGGVLQQRAWAWARACRVSLHVSSGALHHRPACHPIARLHRQHHLRHVCFPPRFHLQQLLPSEPSGGLRTCILSGPAIVS